MDAAGAIQRAKLAIAELFAEEGPFNIALEEVSRDGDKWIVTISFSRKWDSYGGSIAGVLKPSRVAKYVKIDDDGSLLEIKSASPF